MSASHPQLRALPSFLGQSWFERSLADTTRAALQGDDVGDVSGGLGPTGVNCDACHAAQLDGPAGVFTNAATLDGKVALVNAEHTFCFPSWRSLTDSLADAGAVGVLVSCARRRNLDTARARCGGGC